MPPKRKTPAKSASTSPRKPASRILSTPTKRTPRARGRQPQIRLTSPNTEDDTGNGGEASSEDELNILPKSRHSSTEVGLPKQSALKRRIVDDDSSAEPQRSPTKRTRIKAPSTPKRCTTHGQSRVSSPEPPPPQTPISPSKRTRALINLTSGSLPLQFHECLNSQKYAILHALHNMSNIQLEDDPEDDDDVDQMNASTAENLDELLRGTVERGEGNSCLLLGPRGTGKTMMLEHALSKVSSGDSPPIIIRLSGWLQQNDRLAMREIARQLREQTGASFLSAEDEEETRDHDDEPNPFIDTPADDSETLVAEPSSTHLPALIAVLPTLSRASIIILDGFDLFALHARQALLYCLLDTAQSCRAGAGSKGLAVVGLTTRIDTINLLEKRVKSRFSGRILRVAPHTMEYWRRLTKAILCVPIDEDIFTDEEDLAQWRTTWETRVQQFLDDKSTLQTLSETFSITKDMRILTTILTSTVVALSPEAPWPTPSQLLMSAETHRARPLYPYLHNLSYSAICLLIASVHAGTAGYSVVTFEMLHQYFRDQVRSSTAAPVQINGGSIGMVRCSRDVLMSTFEALVAAKIFVLVAAPSWNTAKEFMKYICVVEREDVKRAVDKGGMIPLKKWLNKAQ
ncbi:origin recognition complex subunit 4 C-terminus-domain-containing protein [Desarmillaria tabescens]|uniref:Origin recognition complex subunit 4 n=1 Tax=Armillaria tabescens TaxID=1929756 RepID=A0AA39NMI3_ARMTA|nr:origin recognition complex subunit 4 C-terminus-domain-containing protein [Desarmillaria tabescens]KAK0468397.1 origin recognition complex subunit 4 C-terminus-domain-containing protein [Desarmillaria tabescens]